MTGFNSKRQMSQDKLNDDADTQVYADTLLIVYQQGFADGKRSEQRKPLTDEEIMDAFCITPNIFQFIQAFKAGARHAEAAHNIKEQP